MLFVRSRGSRPSRPEADSGRCRRSQRSNGGAVSPVRYAVKNTNAGRDARFEQLLRDALSNGTPSLRADRCLDAAIAAAWLDGPLDRNERARAETHVAECGQCRARLAALAKATPAPQASSWLRGPAIRWLLPMATATAAVLLWLIVPRTSNRLEDRGAIRMAAKTTDAQPSQAPVELVPKPRLDNQVTSSSAP